MLTLFEKIENNELIRSNLSIAPSYNKERNVAILDTFVRTKNDVRFLKPNAIGLLIIVELTTIEARNDPAVWVYNEIFKASTLWINASVVITIVSIVSVVP